VRACECVRCNGVTGTDITLELNARASRSRHVRDGMRKSPPIACSAVCTCSVLLFKGRNDDVLPVSTAPIAEALSQNGGVR